MNISVAAHPFKLFVSGLSCLLLICIVTSGCRAADTNEVVKNRAQSFYFGQGVKKNLPKAFILYLEAARRGDADAMFIVGGMYMQGIGTEENRKEGFKWLYKAANDGKSSKESERIIGQFLLSGEGVPQNYTEAVQWYERAATGGDAQAQSELAYLYFAGDKVERDYTKAYKWFNLAADQGYALAQYNMGILWYTGNGVSGVDLTKAYAWFSLSSANGHGDGETAKRFLESQLSAGDLKRAQDYASSLYNKIESVSN